MQRLIYLGRLLDDDDKTVQQYYYSFFLTHRYHIEDGSTIQIVPTIQNQQIHPCITHSSLLL